MAPQPPNFILLCGEDTGRHMGCYGDSFARTPTLDQLAQHGCRFRNAFSTAPVCAPARSTLISGQYPQKVGTHLMRIQLKEKLPTFTEELIDAGYYVNWANKTDFNFDPGTTFCSEASDWEKSLAEGKLNDRPFFLFFNEMVTHESHLWPPEAKWHAGYLDEAPEVEESPTQPVDSHPPDGLMIPPYLPNTQTTHASLKRYYNCLKKQDSTWKRLLKALEKSGVSDNTIVLYLSDHGRGLIREKRWCYEAGIHQPLIVRAPESMGLVQANTIRDDLVSWVDIAPTILSLAGIKIPAHYDGRIFLGKKTQPEPQAVYAGRDRMDAAFDRVRVARDRRFLYIKNDHPEIPYAQYNPYMEMSPVTRDTRKRWQDGKLCGPEKLFMQPDKASEELYDTIADPHCVHNLQENADYVSVLKRLRQNTQEWRTSINDLGNFSESELLKNGVIQPNQDAFCNPSTITVPKNLDPQNIYHMRKGIEQV